MKVMILAAMSIVFSLAISHFLHVLDIRQIKADRKAILGIIMISVLGWGVIGIWNRQAPLLFYLKVLLTLSILIPVSFVDVKEHRIPNKILVLWLMVRIALFVLEWPFTAVYLGEYVLAMVIFAGVLFLASIVTKGGVGMGDVKLVGVIGFTLGISGVYGTVFYAVIYAVAMAGIMLVLKKWDRKKHVAFAPFLLAGVITTFMWMG